MSINPEIAERIQGVRFVPGVSGNPAGKSPGARARATRLAEKLMADDTEAVIKAVVAAAKEATRRRPGWCSIASAPRMWCRRWLSSPMLWPAASPRKPKPPE
jgi:hypothetical protein